MTDTDLATRIAFLEDECYILKNAVNRMLDSPKIRELVCLEFGKELERLKVTPLSQWVIDKAAGELDLVFDVAKAKWLSRKDKPGNTLRPWADFDRDHLIERLAQEYVEWERADYGVVEQQELIDIINLAAFLWLRNNADAVEKFDIEENER